MNGYEFCCWLKGVLEMNADGLTAEQLAKISEKLDGVKSPEELDKLASSNSSSTGFVARC